MLSCRLVVLWKRTKRSQLHFSIEEQSRKLYHQSYGLKFKGDLHLTRVGVEALEI